VASLRIEEWELQASRLFSWRVDKAGARAARLLVLDLLESYARERDIHVLLERRSEHDEWVCVLKWDGGESRCVGRTARQAIMEALRHDGVYASE
jgi:hypothetical protein